MVQPQYQVLPIAVPEGKQALVCLTLVSKGCTLEMTCNVSQFICLNQSHDFIQPLGGQEVHWHHMPRREEKELEIFGKEPVS